jgi:hypothetical protein
LLATSEARFRLLYGAYFPFKRKHPVDIYEGKIGYIWRGIGLPQGLLHRTDGRAVVVRYQNIFLHKKIRRM